MKQIAGEAAGAARELKQDWKFVGKYLLETEAHVYAFAVAANVLIAFWPFMLVLAMLFRFVLHWPEGVLAMYAGIQDYFAGGTGAFLVLNLKAEFLMGRRLEWPSLVLLLITANGVFLPLEVALNKAWGVTKHRNLLKNQVVGTALIFACGVLALLSGALTAGGIEAWQAVFGSASEAPRLLVQGLAKLASIPVTILILFLVYCYLPNTDVPKREVLPRVVVVALALESLKWINLAIWPWLQRKFAREFGVFINSVTILTWSFLAALVVLAGAEWTARRVRDRMSEDSSPREVREHGRN